VRTLGGPADLRRHGHWLDGYDSVTVPEIAGEAFVTTRRGWQRVLLDRLFAAEG
jgi:hypothetical protein